MNTRLIYPLFLLFITLIAHSVRAEKVRLEFSATVNHVNDTGNVLSGSFRATSIVWLRRTPFSSYECVAFIVKVTVPFFRVGFTSIKIPTRS